MRRMSFGQGEPQWDPWKPGSPQQQWSDQSGETPDWAALAEASEARNKRRRLLMIGGGALATLLVGAAVAVGVVSADGDAEAKDKPSGGPAADIPSESSKAEPSFAPTSAPPPLDPDEFIASAKKDTAPISAESLYPGTRLTMGDTVYKKGATASTTDCAAAVRGTLTKALTDNGCTRVMRVTYAKDGIAVTVGVALFDTENQAVKAQKAAAGLKGSVDSLSGSGVPGFCNTTICRTTTNSYGRYVYLTVAGFTSGKNVTEKDTAAFSIGDDLREFTHRQIERRGKAQASAAANR